MVLNPHLHVLMLDGVYVDGDGGRLVPEEGAYTLAGNRLTVAVWESWDRDRIGLLFDTEVEFSTSGSITFTNASLLTAGLSQSDRTEYRFEGTTGVHPGSRGRVKGVSIRASGSR